MATPLGAMVIELELDSTKMETSLTRARNQLKNFEKQIKSQKSLDEMMFGKKGSANGLQKQATLLKQSLQTQSQILRKLKSDYDAQVAAKGDMHEKSQRLAGQIEVENNKLIANAAALQRVTRQLHLLQSTPYQIGQSLNALGNGLKRVSYGFQNIGAKTQAMSTAVTLGLGYSVKKAAEFEGSMMEIQALISDTVPASRMAATIDQLSQKSMDWATQYGLTTQQVNDGMKELVKAGYDANQVVDAMPHILNAARASGEDFNTVMESTTSIIAQFGFQAKDAGRVVDSLTFVANKTKADVADMGKAMEYVGPVAHAAGISLEETASAVGLLSNAGIKGEKAGTVLRGALTRLLNPTKANIAAMEQLGFSYEDFKKGAIGLPDILERMKKATEGMTDAEKASLVAKAFGTRAQTGMNALMQQGAEGLRSLTKETREAAGYTQKLADTMNSSSQAKFAQAKAKLEVLAITIGQRLLPTLLPTVEKIADLAKAFSELPQSTQQSIIKMALFAAAISPVSKALGGLTGTLGATAKGLGWAFKKIGEIGANRAAATAISGIAVSAGEATTSLGAMGSAGTVAAGLFSPTGLLVVGAVAGAAALVYFGAKALEAHERAQRWGTEVDAQLGARLSDFKGKVDDANKAMLEFGKGATYNVEGVTKAFQELNKEVEKLAQKNNAEFEKLGKELGLSDEAIAEMKVRNQQYVDNTQQMSDQVISIYKNAAAQHRTLTNDERAMVENNQREMIEAELALLKVGGDKKIAITKAMTGHLNELNATQKREAYQTTLEWIGKEKKAYEDRKAKIEKALSETDSSQVKLRQELNQKLEQLEGEHSGRMDAFRRKAFETRVAMAKEELKGLTGEAYRRRFQEIANEIKYLGYSADELRSHLNGTNQDVAKFSTMLAKYWDTMSEEARKAADHWNGLIFDPKTGTVKTNAKEEIGKAIQSSEGWEQIKFDLKEAKISTEGHLLVAQALVEAGKWNSLSLEEKQLVVNHREGLQAIFDSEKNLRIWNSLPVDVKNILANDKDFSATAQNATNMLERWNGLHPKEMELIAKDLASGDAERVRNALAKLKGRNIEIKATDMTPPTLKKVQEGINGLQGTTVPLNADPQGAQTGSKSAIDSVLGYHNLPNPPKPLKVDPSNAQQGSNNAIGSVLGYHNMPNPTKPLRADPSNAQQGSRNATNAINSVPNGHHTTITASDATGPGVSSALWQLAAIPAVKTITINAVSTIGGILGGLHFATGTNYHRGGLAIVNDQKGPLYKELIEYPTGEQFIPQGRNVVLDMPRGTKVYPASKTREIMRSMGIPKYEHGVGIPRDAMSIQRMEAIPDRKARKENGNGAILNLLAGLVEQNKKLYDVLTKIANKETTFKAEINGREYANFISDITEAQRAEAQLRGAY